LDQAKEMALFNWPRKDRHLDMLRKLATDRSQPMEEWLRQVPRRSGNHHDFFEAASLFHFGFVETTTLESQGRSAGQLGDDIDDTAQILCQFTLADGQTFQLDGCAPRQRWDPNGFRVFVTARGIEKLSEIDDRASDRRLLVLVAVLSAVAGSAITVWVG
jgi:hypothetical protein